MNFCLTMLAFEKEKTELEAKRINNNFNGSR